MSDRPVAVSGVSPAEGAWEWLLAAASVPAQARAEWRHSRTAWFVPGTLFAAVTLPAQAVHAAMGSWAWSTEFADRLDEVCDGPLFYRPPTHSEEAGYTALVSCAMAMRWYVPGTTVEPAHRPLLVPAPDRFRPEAGPWWVSLVAGPDRLFSARALTRLFNAGRGRWLDS